MRAMPRTIAVILAVASALVTPPRRKTTTLAARAKTRTPYDFTYASAAERRYAAEAQMRRRSAARGPGGASGLKVVLLGKPASGKGTIAPMLCTAYRVAQVGLGNLLRSRARVGGGGDDAVADAMRSGRLLPDDLALSVVAERVSRRDAVACGWLLDGFPRTAAQAEEMDRLFLLPDKCVILDVPKDVLVERVTGRRTDPETGKIYHLKFNPPKVDPDDESEEAAAKATAETEAIVARLTQREDDTEEALAKRLEAFDSNRAAIEDAFSAMAKVVDGNRDKSAVWETVKAFFAA